MIEETRKKRIEEEKAQKESFQKLIESLEGSISFFKKEEYQNAEEFCMEIKKYYFKQNLDVYVEEYDLVIKQYQEKVVNYSPFSWSKDTEAKCKQFIKDLYKLEGPKEKEKEKIEKVEATSSKKQIKKKEPQRKRCGKCGQEMEYLTEWKKHLVCRGCGGKERNYVKK